jgi:hypothetical protein
MSKFLERLNEGKDEKAAKANNLVEANAKAQVEQKISSLKAQAATLSAAYEQALGSSSFSIDRIFQLTKEVAQNQADLVLAEKILKEEF